MPASYKKQLLLLISASTLVRLVVAGLTELGNDEVYYWTYSQRLQWNYFDHPPMVAFWIKAFTANLRWQHAELFIRLGSIVSAAFCTWIIFETTARLHTKKAGWYAACLYTASLYASIIAGLFILPDSPQMLFWCACLYLLVRIQEQPESWKHWLLWGAAAGLCMMSKVHGIFIPLGLALYLLFKRRNWLKLPQLYIAVCIMLVLISPIFFWNWFNDFITYRYHSERVEVHGFSIDATSFAREVFGQFFYNNPFNVAILVAALFAWRAGKIPASAPLLLYAFVALPMIGVLIFVSLFRSTLPHWSGPGYVTLMPLAAIYLSTLPTNQMPRQLRASLVTTALILLVGLGLIFFYPGTMGNKKSERYGTGDFTLDLHGWRKAGTAFAKIYQTHLANGTIPKGTPVVAHKWFPAAHEDYYFCRPMGIQLIGLGSVLNLHQYAWSNRWRLPEANMNNAFCIVPSNESYSPQEEFSRYYNHIDSVAAIQNWRGGKLTRTFTVFLLHGWKGTLPPLY